MFKRLFFVLVVMLGIFAAAPAAFAATWSKSTSGSSVLFNNNTQNPDTDLEGFQVCDTEADGNSPYVDFVYNGGITTGRHYNRNGAGTCQNFYHSWPENRDLDFRSCEQRDNYPDDCSDYQDAET